MDMYGPKAPIVLFCIVLELFTVSTIHDAPHFNPRVIEFFRILMKLLNFDELQTIKEEVLPRKQSIWAERMNRPILKSLNALSSAS